MERRHVLKLGAVASGVFALGGMRRLSAGVAGAQTVSVPTVDRLVMTNVVDNVYDIFSKGGKLDTITVQRAPYQGRVNALLSEHGLAYHLDSLRGGERREILLDFSLTDLTLFNNYRALGVDPTRADALVISHGHRDHYGALTELARTRQGKLKPGLALYAGGEDTFCHRVSVAPIGATIDQGQLDRGALEGRGINVVLAKQPPRAGLFFAAQHPMSPSEPAVERPVVFIAHHRARSSPRAAEQAGSLRHREVGHEAPPSAKVPAAGPA
jgi:7,8-dihydropterin-6-yl-methyl-4-(beta-D-ribofuranosyl)aminobenzene 5'-phosphate synthase